MNILDNHSIKELVNKAKEEKLYEEILFSRLYYKIEKKLKDYKGKKYEKAKQLAENILKQAIDEYILSDFTYDISHYIDNKFQKFDKKLSEEFIFANLEKKAYQGDNEAQKNLFKIYKKTLDAKLQMLDEKVKNVYYKYLILDMESKDDFSYLDDDFEFTIPNNLYDKDNLFQVYYMFVWDKLNQFYTGKYQINYFSTYINRNLSYHLDVELEEITKKIIDYFKYSENFIDVNLLYFQDYFVKMNNTMELKDLIKVIEFYLGEKEKMYLDSIKEKHFYQGINNSYKIARSTACLRRNKIKQLTKKYKIVI